MDRDNHDGLSPSEIIPTSWEQRTVATGVDERATRSPKDVRERVHERVLWLACMMVHWANHERPSKGGIKVGGHQSASASSAAILSALYFETLNASDRVAVKPHASPVYHAIQYLLGFLPDSYLTKFREYGGLQAYPSRTKDPDSVDFSTGAVGLGPAAVTFGALVRDYLSSHDLPPNSGRFFAHMGDGELDEGMVWEAVDEPLIEHLGQCVWIVDVNRQSLDRVIPGIRIDKFRRMFEANGWPVVMVKYGERLDELMGQPGGDALRTRVDEMPNEEYQAILRAPVSEVRQRLLANAGSLRGDLRRCIGEVDDQELATRIGNLGGHDIAALARAYELALSTESPSVVFAYTIKGWGLPISGDPRNHSALLSREQMHQLAERLEVSWEDPWPRFDDGSEPARYIEDAARRLRRQPYHAEAPIEFDATRLTTPHRTSTQDAFGRMLVELDRSSPESASRLVTVSPDVASSTSLSSWINRVGVWSRSKEPDYLGFSNRVVKWIYEPGARHVELGLSENNLFSFLGQLGLSEAISARRLIPIGTVYDPFVNRGLDALIHQIYQGARFVLVATPSGVSLSSEGGAHQGLLSPTLGINLPGIVYYEPFYARDLEWILLWAVRQLGSGTGESVLLRLTTKPVQQPSPNVADVDQLELERQVLNGCYRLRPATRAHSHAINLFSVGAMTSEALTAADMLHEEGVAANVFAVTSPDLLHRRFRAGSLRATDGEDVGRFDPTGLLSETEMGLPIVTVLDGHPHVLSFLGSALHTPCVCLGADAFGQSGTPEDLYRHFRMDAYSIFSAALTLTG